MSCDGPLCVEAAAQLAELEREQEERGELRGESLGGGDADLRAGVGVDGAVGFARDHGADDVADGDGLRAEANHFALRGERVGGFAGLGDEQAEGVAVGDGIAIAVFAGVVDVDGQTREALDHVLAGEGGVPTGAAGGDVDAGGARRARRRRSPFRRGRSCRSRERRGPAWCREWRAAAPRFP